MAGNPYQAYVQVFIVYRGFPEAQMVKNPPANAGDVRDMGLIPG